MHILKPHRIRKAASLLLAALLALAWGISLPSPASATTYTLNFDSVLQGANISQREIFVGVPVKISLEDVAEQDDRLMAAYLNGDITGIYYYCYWDSSDSGYRPLTRTANDVYTWTPTANDLNYKTYFSVRLANGDDWNNSTHGYVTIRNLPDGNAGTLTLTLTGKRVELYKGIPLPDGRSDYESEIFENTLKYAAKHGIIGTYSWSLDPEDSDYYLTRIDLDRDGTKDLLVRDDTLSDSMIVSALSNASVAGDFTLSIPTAGQLALNMQHDSFYSRITFQLCVPMSKTSVSVKDCTYNGKAQTPKVTVTFGGKTLKEGTHYQLSWKNNKSAGKGTVTVTGLDSRYTGSVSRKFTIARAANPLKMKAKTATVSFTDLSRESQKLSIGKVIHFTKKGKGEMSYTLSSAKKGDKSYKNKFSIHSKNGKITVKKGLEKGTYRLKLRIKAAGDKNYKPSSTKTITVTIKVE